MQFVVLGRLRSLAELSNGATSCEELAMDGCLLAWYFSVKMLTILTGSD